MKNKTLLLSIVFLCYSFVVFAQKNVEGKVVESKGETPLPFASVIIKDTQNTIVEGVITTENGVFKITDLKNGVFTLEVQYTGFSKYSIPLSITDTTQKRLDLGIIQMNEDPTQLEEVVITGEQAQVSLRLDKKVFNVSKDLISQAGAATDVLDNIPSVTVSPSGGISLRGNSNVNILINGRRSGLTEAQALEQLPADTIDRVEVITNPSARYDAAGAAGIINIVLKKNKANGINGQVRLVSGTPDDYRAIGSLNYKANKFNVFANLGIRYTDYEGLYTRNQETQNNGITNILNQRQNEDRHDDGRLIYLGADYYLNDKNTFTIAFYRNETKDTDKTDYVYDYFTENLRDSTLVTIGNSREKRNYNQFEFNYTKTFAKERQKLTFDIQYDFWESTKRWKIDIDKILPEITSILDQRTTTTNDNNDFAAQIDFINPIKEKKQFETGVKYETRTVSNSFFAEELIDTNFVSIDPLDNSIDYDEQIFSTYAQFGNTSGKLSYLGGVRMEYTRVNIEDENSAFSQTYDYNRFFPSVNLKYAFNEENTLQLNYSKRINRPRLWQLNPFFELIDFNRQSQGNPDLRPVFTDGIELSFLKTGKGFSINPSIYFSNSENTIQRLTVQNEESIFVSTLFNLDSETRYGFEFVASYSPFKWLKMNGEFNYFAFEEKGMAASRSFDFSDDTWFSSLDVRATLPEGFRLQGRFLHEGQRNNAQTKTKSISYLNLGLSKSLFNKRASVVLNVSNVFNTRKTRETISGNDFTVNRVLNRNAARWTLSFSYKFGNAQNRNAKRSNRN
ncbi:TonB-dependent receptor domain-containing protein [Aquimarina sp. AU119]|uniref:TonB-dependent receptor domain-containing protein n=1 Tax=Aquimarina sp. AU119 TaxID=2108528 RepID=UPI000D69A75B|nr:TonB-dependent receptor [Aquimarina sp. AU119]